MSRYFIVIILFINLCGIVIAQQSSLSKGVNYLTEYIASPDFQELKRSKTDLSLVDSIYVKAVQFYEGEIEDALLALTFATVPYKKVPIQIPLIKAVIKYPLVSHNDSLFYKKNIQLPSKLFFNSPDNESGDKDKLAHFFGSAYISYQSNIFDLGDLIGYFIEAFEESFKVQSRVDYRDLETNKLGNIFGESLKKNRNTFPSGVLLTPALKFFRYTL